MTSVKQENQVNLIEYNGNFSTWGSRIQQTLYIYT